MTSAQSRGGRPAVFVQQLHRAAAQRGKLDPVYQELSDHWTAILQRLYPVWALIGPGLSDPGHIEIHSRTIYLDSETLLGQREQIAAGRLEQRAILRCFGVAIHETLHAKHTKRWAIEHDIALSESHDPASRQLAIDRRLLEEPRMEAHGVREHPASTARGRFVRRALEAAVIDVILPAFAAELRAAAMTGTPLTRDMAGRATAYLQARTQYGIVKPPVLDAVRAVWRRALGDPDLAALDELFARVIWIADGELDALDRAAREYRAIIGPADPSPSNGAAGGHGQDAHPEDKTEGRGADEDASADHDSPPPAGSLGEALQQALQSAAEGSSSSWTRTSSCKRCSSTPHATVSAPPAARPPAAPDCRRAACPTAASTARPRPRRSSTPAATPPACAKRSPTAPGRSTSATRPADSTAAPTPAHKHNGPPEDRSPATRGGSPAKCAPRSRSRTSDW